MKGLRIQTVENNEEAQDLRLVVPISTEISTPHGHINCPEAGKSMTGAIFSNVQFQQVT